MMAKNSDIGQSATYMTCTYMTTNHTLKDVMELPKHAYTKGEKVTYTGNELGSGLPWY